MGLRPFGGAPGRWRRRSRLGPVSREYYEALGEFAQFGAGSKSGELEQVAGDVAGDAIGARLLGRDLLGLLQVVEGLADLPSHGGGCGEVDQVAGPAFGLTDRRRRRSWPDRALAQDDGDRDGMDSDVRRPELGAVVIAVLADLLGDLAGMVEVVVGERCARTRDHLRHVFGIASRTRPLGAACSGCDTISPRPGTRWPGAI